MPQPTVKKMLLTLGRFTLSFDLILWQILNWAGLEGVFKNVPNNNLLYIEQVKHIRNPGNRLWRLIFRPAGFSHRNYVNCYSQRRTIMYVFIFFPRAWAWTAWQSLRLRSLTAVPLDQKRAVAAHPRTELSEQAAEKPALKSPCSLMLLESGPIYLAIIVEQD